MITTLVLTSSAIAMAQETHYHRSLRGQDTAYGLIQEPRFNGSGMYWSRVRNVDDVTINQETPEDSIARLKEFKRLCENAYAAFEAKDYYHTIMYGDSALRKRYHTLDLYYFLGVSYETLGAYDDAEWTYKKAMKGGYTKVPAAYPDFKDRMKQRKKGEKRLKAEEKRKEKEEKKRLKQN